VGVGGGLGERKGAAVLVAALGRLAADPSWSADLVGDGDLRAIKEAARAHGIEDRLTIPGWLEEDQLEATLGSADIFVLPSFDENLPLPVVEAFARRIPVITTPVGALPEIVEHERNGLFVKPGDVDGLAKNIQRLLHDPALRHRLASNARSLFEERLEISDYTHRLV